MLRNITTQVVIFVSVFSLFSWLQTMSMLSTNEKLSENIELSTTMDKTITLKANSKKTVIYFFAPWCNICHLSISNLQALYEKNDNIDVIAVALDYLDIDEVNKFTEQHQLTFPVALGLEKVKRVFKISGYPSYYILDEENTVIARSKGYSSEFGLYLRTL